MGHLGAISSEISIFWEEGTSRRRRSPWDGLLQRQRGVEGAGRAAFGGGGAVAPGSPGGG
jgi:hypothetical protein